MPDTNVPIGEMIPIKNVDINKYNPEGVDVENDVILSDDQKKFIEAYRQKPIAVHAFKMAFPERSARLKPNSLKSMAWKILQSVGNHVDRKQNRLRPDFRVLQKTHIGLEAADKKVNLLKFKYASGELGEEDLWNQMRYLAFSSPDDRTRFVAVKELREWFLQAKEQLAVSKLEEMDVVRLITEAIALLPKSKYLDVLIAVRKQRQALIAKRTETIDATALINEHRSIKHTSTEE